MQKTTIKLFLLLSLFTLNTLFAKTSQESYVTTTEKKLPAQCLFYFKMYLNAQEPKAFSYAIDSSEKVTCRFSNASDNQKKAEEVALHSCKKSAKKKGIISKCKLYKTDKAIPKSKKKLSFEEKYLVNLRKVKRDTLHPKTKKAIPTKKKPQTKKLKIPTVHKSIKTLPQPCIMFYKLFIEAKPYKAFAIAIDNDKKYVCKYSAGSTTQDKANEVALSSCKKTKDIRSVKKPCQLFILDKKKSLHEVDIPKQKELLKKKHILTQKPDKKKNPKVTKSHALERAILSANLSLIKKLIKKGADINVEAKDKSRALFVSVAQGDIAFTKELLDKGAYPFIKKRDGNNLLVAAIMSGKHQMLTLMLKQNINPNIRCEEGNTPLHFALMMFDDNMMKTLYTFNARDDIKNAKGKSVQDMAKELHLNLKRIKR